MVNRGLANCANSSQRSLGGRLVSWVIDRQQRKADRQILDVLATLPNKYRDNFVTELQHRMSGL
jgi:hypothetical protein